MPLLAAARRGDTAAFGTLVMRHQSRLRRQMRHLVRGRDAVADELAQDAFVMAWRRIADFRGEARFSTERALARLPDAQRLALFHCFQLDLSHEEAAEVLGVPVGTLKSHVARGKDRLREALAAWAPARQEGS